MSSITLRLNDELQTDIEQVCSRDGVSKSTAIKTLIKKGLGRHSRADAIETKLQAIEDNIERIRLKPAGLDEASFQPILEQLDALRSTLNQVHTILTVEDVPDTYLDSLHKAATAKPPFVTYVNTAVLVFLSALLAQFANDIWRYFSLLLF